MIPGIEAHSIVAGLKCMPISSEQQFEDLEWSRVRHEDRIEGGLLGLLIGDAVGVPYEFHSADSLPPLPMIDLVPPSGFARAHAHVPPGTWSDDGAQALVLLESLVRNGRFVLDDFAKGLVNWRDEGFLAVDGIVFDVGLQTEAAIQRLRRGLSAALAGGASERDNGNGSLMRVLPLALWYRGTDLDLCRAAVRQSLPTHAHPRAQLACAMLCLWARWIYARSTPADAWVEAAQSLPNIAIQLGLPSVEVELLLDLRNAQRIGGSGYVVDTLWSARWCLEQGHTYEGVVHAAIGLGNDTDTTAAVAGGLAGLHYGVGGIPERWRAGLRGAEMVQPLLEALLYRVSIASSLHRAVPRTSAGHPLQIVAISLGSGCLAVTECPGRKATYGGQNGKERHERDLGIDLDVIRAWGADHVVTLLEPDEVIDLSITALADEIVNRGMTWHHLPRSGRSANDTYFDKDLACLAPKLRQALASGKKIVIHATDWEGRLGQASTDVLLSCQPHLTVKEASSLVKKALSVGRSMTERLTADS
jgi:ADP-ribosylglycohydrolase